MSYISYKAQGRPTREEIIEAVFESYLNMTRAIKKLEKIYKRELNYRKRKYKNSVINNL